MYTSVKNRVFSHDVRRAGMVVGIRKVCAVHQRPCALVPAYHPAVDVLDHDVVWRNFSAKFSRHPLALPHIFAQGHEVI